MNNDIFKRRCEIARLISKVNIQGGFIDDCIPEGYIGYGCCNLFLELFPQFEKEIYDINDGKKDKASKQFKIECKKILNKSLYKDIYDNKEINLNDFNYIFDF